MSAPLRIIFAGSGEFGLPTLGAIAQAGHEIALVVSQPDRPAGRGREMTPTPISRFALERGLALVRTADVNAEPLPGADLLVVIAFGQKISPHVADHARLGAVNLHASLLPRYRGAAPINWAIINGETVTGNSVIRLAQRMDAGAVLGQSTLQIGPTETAGELHDRLASDGAGLVLRVMEALARGKAAEREQDDPLATLAPKLTREASRLDWARPAAELCNRIRGLWPWPGCRVRLLTPGGEESARLSLVSCVAGPDCDDAPPGTIAHDGRIRAGQGAVEVVSLQPAGKRPMSLREYRNGHAWEAGMRLESIT